MTNPLTVEQQSIQEHEPNTSQGAGLWYSLPANNPKDDVLLPEWGLHERDRRLRLLYRNQFNWLAQSAVAALTRKFTQTPWQLQGGRNLTTYFQSLLQNADFDDGWSDFWSQVLLDYLTCDYGAYIEIIGAGRADGPIRGRVTGIAHLDSLRCIPTGNLEFPVVYWSRRSGKLHRIHHTRVIRLVDMRDGDELRFGVGMCSLARAVAIIQQQIPMMRYISGQVSDIPANGVMFLPPGITSDQYHEAVDEYKRRRDTKGYRGEMVIGLPNSTTDGSKTHRVPFAVAPEGFDYSTYIEIAVNAFAAAFGIDRQDLWPLTGRMAGTATQSEIISQKAMGMAFGDLLSKVKRAINTKVLPPSLEFDFEYRDEEKDKQVAERTSILLNNASMLRSLGANDEAVMRYLAMQDETLRDVLLDDNGDIVSLPDDDVLDADQVAVADDDVQSTATPDTNIETDDKASKDNGSAAYAYIPLVNNPDVLHIQRELKKQFPDERIEWQSAPTLHVALAFAGIMDDSAIEKLSTLIHLEAVELQPELDEPLGIFKTPDGQALHIAIAHNSVLDAIHANVYSAFETEGHDLSEFSKPESYNPHITLAYVPDDIDLGDLNKEDIFPSFVIKSDTVVIGRGDYDPQLILKAPEHIKAKDITDTQVEFMSRFSSILDEARAGTVNRARAGILIRGLIRTIGSRAFGDGLEEGGVERDQLDKSDTDTIARLIAEQSGFVSNLTDVIFNGDGITDEQADGKARMWFNKTINPFFDAGRMSADANGMYEFRVGPTEHCKHCKMLNGQIHRLKTFLLSGWYPKSSQLECGGYNCECEFIKVPGAKARGTLPKVINLPDALPAAA